MHDQSTGKASPSIGRGARPNGSRSRSLPSAIEICLAEKISPAKAKRLARDKRFCKELQDQVLHDLSHFPYVDTLDCTEPLDANDFILYSSAEISPLRLEGKCNCSACLAKYVAEFARGSCLYADVVVLTDSFSQGILRTPPGRWTPDRLMRSISVLTKLDPVWCNKAAEASLANRRGRVGCWRCRRWGPRNGRLAGHYRPILPRLGASFRVARPARRQARHRPTARDPAASAEPAIPPPNSHGHLPRVAPVAGIGTGLSIVEALTASSHPQPRVLNYGTGTPLPLGNFRGEKGRNPKIPLPPPASPIRALRVPGMLSGMRLRFV